MLAPASVRDPRHASVIVILAFIYLSWIELDSNSILPYLLLFGYNACLFCKRQLIGLAHRKRFVGHAG
jgi:hypothetical protein